MSNDINNRRPKQRHQLQTSGLISPVRRRMLQAGLKTGGGLVAGSALLHGQALAQLIPHGMWRNRATTTTTTTLPPAGSAGTLWVSGANSVGQLGIGTTDSEIIPEQVGALSNWTQISAGFNHSMGILSNGTLWTWGGNDSGSLMRTGVGGALGQSDLVNRSSPTQIAGSWKMCAAGMMASFAIKTDNTLWAWGINDSGWLGQNNFTHRSSPVQISGTWNWVSACTASYAVYNNTYYYLPATSASAIRSDGTLWDLGYRITGAYASSPVQLAGGSWLQSANGTRGDGMAIRSDGTLWVRGKNNLNGLLGNGTTTEILSPVQLAGSWKQVSMGYRASGMIKTNGTLWMCGDGDLTGQGNTTHQSSPVQVAGSWKQITVGSFNGGVSIGIRTDDTMWVWGNVTQPGGVVGPPFTRSSPVQLAGSWIQASASSDHVLRIKV